MAISIFQQPYDYNPIHNPIMLHAGSNNTGNIDFKYKVTIQVPGALDRTLFVSPRPVDSRLELDLSTHLRDYLDHDDFILPTGFNFTAAPHVEFSLTIQENWEGVDQEAVESIEGLIATNVLMNRQQELQEKVTQYDRFHIRENGFGVSNQEVLIHKPLGVPMFQDEYYYIHVVGIPNNTFMYIQITQYAQDGTLLFPQYTNSAGASTQLTEAKYAKLDLSAISFNANTTRIGLIFKDGLGNDLTLEKFFDVEPYQCKPWERWKLLYLDRYGSYNNLSLDMISQSKFKVEPKTFRKRIDPLTDTSKKRGVTRYHQKSERMYMLNTDYLTEAQAEIMEDLISSPRVFRDVRGIDGWSNGDFLPVEILTKELDSYSYGANDLPQYTIKARYSYPENIRHE